MWFSPREKSQLKEHSPCNQKQFRNNSSPLYVSLEHQQGTHNILQYLFKAPILFLALNTALTHHSCFPQLGIPPKSLRLFHLCASFHAPLSSVSSRLSPTTVSESVYQSGTFVGVGGGGHCGEVDRLRRSSRCPLD